MSGIDAVKQLLSAVAREDLVDAGLVARALGRSKRKLLRDWRKRGKPETRVGRDVLLASRLVLAVYFPHHVSGN